MEIIYPYGEQSLQEKGGRVQYRIGNDLLIQGTVLSKKGGLDFFNDLQFAPSGKRKVSVTDVTQEKVDCRNCQVGIDRIKVQQRNTNIHLNCSCTHIAAVNDKAFEIFFEKISGCFKNKVFIT